MNERYPSNNPRGQRDWEQPGSGRERHEREDWRERERRPDWRGESRAYGGHPEGAGGGYGSSGGAGGSDWEQEQERGRWAGSSQQGSRYGQGRSFSEEQGYGQGGTGYDRYGQGAQRGYGQGGFFDQEEGFEQYGRWGQGGSGSRGGYGQGQAGQGRAYGRGGHGQGGAAGGYGEGQGGRWEPTGSPWWSRGSHRRFNKGPKGYSRSDERIKEDISERLMSEEGIDPGEVSIQVTSGVVVLEGSVPERHMKYIIEDVVDSCIGVKDVQNQLRVSRSGEGEASSQGFGSLSGQSGTESSMDKSRKGTTGSNT